MEPSKKKAVLLKHRWQLVLLVAVIFVLAACKGTASGSITSTNGIAKAKFSLNFTYNESTGALGLTGTFRDPLGTIGGVCKAGTSGETCVVLPQITNVDVNLKGTGQMQRCKDGGCRSSGTKGGCIGGDVPYKSQNSKYPGDGMLYLQLCDGDDDGSVDDIEYDSIFISISTGPYAGYINGGPPSGNVGVKN
jgi:hypothetical protein